ncbi:MAG: hypothetical protein LBH58_05095 [Tannerellaceae bacterium]|nr:hypothetical protein [Tannerellaceae bacterium]
MDSTKIRYTIDVDGRTPPEGFWLRDTTWEEAERTWLGRNPHTGSSLAST